MESFTANSPRPPHCAAAPARVYGSSEVSIYVDGAEREGVSLGERGPVTEHLSTCAPGPFSAGGPGLGMNVCA